MLDSQTPHGNHLARLHNIPVQLTSLVGRQAEVTSLRELLRRDDIRLVTLTGAPGIGKTRLAVEAAVGLLDDFGDGIYFVNLAPVTDPDKVVQAIAATLGIRQIGDQSLEENLSRYLSGKRILLVLDNFEQVIPAGPMLAGLLKSDPALMLLVTSRELLRLSGEQDFPVPPLLMPPVLAAQDDSGKYTPLHASRVREYESVQLFAQRAAAYRPDFTLSEENTTIVAAICRKLDGLPLAIELAAARVRHMAPQAILDRLQDRLTLLTGGARDVPLRHRTLRATIEWSYSLLNEQEQLLFRRLAVFRGGCSLEAIENVCNFDAQLNIEALSGVVSLVDKSLLQPAFQSRGGDGAERETRNAKRDDDGPFGPRFIMLETLQEYAREQLGQGREADSLHEAHATYFTELAERAEPELHGHEQVEWLNRLESEQNNFQAALGWAYDNRLDLGLRMVGALNIYWNRRGYLIEGRHRAAAMLARARETGMKVVVGNATSVSLPLKGQMEGSMARALYALGLIAFRQADYRRAQQLLDESIEIYRKLRQGGDYTVTRPLIESLNVLGIVVSRLHNMQARRALHEEALELAGEIGDSWSSARSLYQLGHVARLTGDYTLGRSLFEDSLARFREAGDSFNIALALIGMGQIEERQGDYRSALAFFQEAFDLFTALGDQWGISGAFYCLGSAYMGLGEYARARTCLQANIDSTQELGTVGDQAEALEKLGKVAYFQGDYAEAFSLYKRSLAQSEALGDKMGVTRCLMDLAGVMTVAGMDETRDAKRETRNAMKDEGRRGADRGLVNAARLLGLTSELLEKVGFRFDPWDRELYDGYVAAARNRLGEEAFSKAWAEGHPMSMKQAIEYVQGVDAPGPAGGETRNTKRETRGATKEGGGLEPGVLTRREREVAVLISQGKTNRVIGEELVVSERTVEGHVNNILSKLGFRSRAQISAWVVGKGLVKLPE